MTFCALGCDLLPGLERLDAVKGHKDTDQDFTPLVFELNVANCRSYLEGFSNWPAAHAPLAL